MSGEAPQETEGCLCPWPLAASPVLVSLSEVLAPERLERGCLQERRGLARALPKPGSCQRGRLSLQGSSRRFPSFPLTAGRASLSGLRPLGVRPFWGAGSSVKTHTGPDSQDHGVRQHHPQWVPVGSSELQEDFGAGLSPGEAVHAVPQSGRQRCGVRARPQAPVRADRAALQAFSGRAGEGEEPLSHRVDILPREEVACGGESRGPEMDELEAGAGAGRRGWNQGLGLGRSPGLCALECWRGALCGALSWGLGWGRSVSGQFRALALILLRPPSSPVWSLALTRLRGGRGERLSLRLVCSVPVCFPGDRPQNRDPLEAPGWPGRWSVRQVAERFSTECGGRSPARPARPDQWAPQEPPPCFARSRSFLVPVGLPAVRLLTFLGTDRASLWPCLRLWPGGGGPGREHHPRSLLGTSQMDWRSW